jgi:hypothetical protein
MVLRHMTVDTLINVERYENYYFALWSAIKICNMFFIYRLVRFLPASKNIRIIVGTVVDQMRNGGSFFGVLFVSLMNEIDGWIFIEIIF